MITKYKHSKPRKIHKIDSVDALGIIFLAHFLSLFKGFKTHFLGGTFSSLGCFSSPMPTESVEKLQFMVALL